MKKIFLIFVLLVLIFLFFYPLITFKNAITLNSNVQVGLEDLLYKLGPLYITIFPKKDIIITRKPFHVTIEYNEKALFNIKLKDGIFGFTQSGFLVEMPNSNFELIGNFESKFYNEDIKEFLLFFSKSGMSLDNLKSVELLNGDIAFVDKNGILVIIGKGDYEIKMKEYDKALVVLASKKNFIKSIDLRYSMQAVITWRENG